MVAGEDLGQFHSPVRDVFFSCVDVIREFIASTTSTISISTGTTTRTETVQETVAAILCRFYQGLCMIPYTPNKSFMFRGIMY